MRSHPADPRLGPLAQHQVGQGPDEGVEAVGRGAAGEAARPEIAEFVFESRQAAHMVDAALALYHRLEADSLCLLYTSPSPRDS